MNPLEMTVDRCLQHVRSEHHRLVARKNGAYTERNKVVVAMLAMASKFVPDCVVYCSLHDENDKNWDSDWRNIIIMEYKDNQYSWHVHDNDSYLLDGFPFREKYEWDGHTTEVKYDKLLSEFNLWDELK